LEGGTEGTTAIRFSPDGKRVASGSQDSTVIIWDMNSGPAGAHGRGHIGLKFSDREAGPFPQDSLPVAGGGRHSTSFRA